VGYFEISKKTGFRTTDKEIRICTNDGKECYFVNNLKPYHDFNLPAGKYYTENRILKLTQPVFFDVPPTPKPNRRVMIPNGRLNIMYRNNPHKASINCAKGILILDFKIKELPKFKQDFIFFHELGHQYYGGYNAQLQKDEYMQAEINCDTYAAINMIVKGYNPSQSFISVRDCLSLPERIEASEKFNLKIKKNENTNNRK